MKGFSQAIRIGIQGSGLAAIAIVTMPLIALAHGAHIQSRTTSAIEIKASYDNGEPMAEAQVQVYSPEDPQTPLFTGITDKDGEFVFVPDQPGDWEVSVRQAGHGDIAVIPVETGSTEVSDTEEADSIEVNNTEIPLTIAEDFSSSATLSPLQRTVIAGAVTWGFVGTALFFWRDKQWRGKQ